MDMRDLLLQVADTYDSTASTSAGVPAQDLLRAVPDEIGLLVPAGLEVAGYGGKGGATATPWIGVFDPDETRDPKENLYLAYIFASDLESVTLTLQQGVTRLKEELQSGQRLRTRLEENARRLRNMLPEKIVSEWSDKAEFKHSGWRAKAYEASSVAARRYEVQALPPELTLRKDLTEMAKVLQWAASVEKASWYGVAPGGPGVTYAGRHRSDEELDPLDEFQPKSDSDYLAVLSARKVEKTRRHETLISQFGPYVAGLGFKPITNGVHPRDLVLRKDGDEWLVEAKVVRRGNATEAVRGALAQLLEYSHFLYAQSAVEPKLVALFTEEVGAYVNYLESHGIASIWKTPEGWAGSISAVKFGLVAPA
ncbi:DUF3578 domain-containing protein [Streptomyces sp. NPDC048845]|uniref:MrcB family domain-containing protein n=1 Tax=Streptomyces sp. NPDC048845 TaxID=3155390 RepID=UPI003433B012